MSAASSSDGETKRSASSGSDSAGFGDEDDDDATVQAEYCLNGRKSPFVACTRLAKEAWLKREIFLSPWTNRVEYELRPGATLEDVAVLSDAFIAGKQASRSSANPVIPPARNLTEMLGSRADALQVFWLSSHVFLAKGYTCDWLEKESKNQHALIVDVHCESTNAHQYCVYCSTRLPSGRVEESVAAVDWVLIVIADWCQWRRVKLVARRTPRPCSASTEALQKIVSAGHPDGCPRDLLFDYHGLSDDQWREVFKCLHPATQITVTGALADTGNNCFPCLMEAIRHGYGPRKLAVRCGDEYAGTQMEDLGTSLSERACAVKEIYMYRGPSNSAAYLALVSSLATPATGLEKLEVHLDHLSDAEWASTWTFAATCRALSTVHLSTSWSLSSSETVSAIEAAVRSNRRLTTIAIKTFSDPLQETRAYKKKVLPHLRTNRIRGLARDVKECPDAPWRIRLFSVSLLRMCHRGGGAADPSRGKAGNAAAARRMSLSFVFHLLRQNPDVLENCCRLPDVLRRQWDEHMRAATYHLGRVSELERRMVLSGTEIPQKSPLPESES